MIAILCLLLGLVVGAAVAFVVMILCWPGRQDLADEMQRKYGAVRQIGEISEVGVGGLVHIRIVNPPPGSYLPPGTPVFVRS